jgi:hypothetical protein
MQWIYQNEPVDELPADCVGIVYLITNADSGRMYIGKKLAQFKTTRYRMHTQKNGKKVRKKIRGAVASDWQDYYGSSDALSKDIERLGRDRFRREILYYCRSKAEIKKPAYCYTGFWISKLKNLEAAFSAFLVS